MALFRSVGHRIIDDAHNRICSAEMMVAHAFTDEAKAEALDELGKAMRYLRRACETKRAWDAIDHDDYETYPVATSDEQAELF